MADDTQPVNTNGPLNHDYDYTNGKLTPKGGAKPADPNRVPLGDGLADRARQAVKGRQSQVDKAIEDAGG